MRLRGITLANFKSFADETEIPLGQITCIIGPNGAGKSNALSGLERITAVLSGDKSPPARSDYFDNNDSARMRLGATLELSGAERQALLDRIKPGFPHPGREPPAGPALFSLVKYAAMFKDNSLHRQEVQLPAASGKFYTFARATTDGDGCNVERRDLNTIHMENMIVLSDAPGGWDGQPDADDLFRMLAPSLADAVKGLFARPSTIPAGRSIPPTVPVRQSDGLTSDGRNLPNELNDLRRADQTEFDKRMARVTRGDPLGVEPRTVGTDLVLEVREKGLSRKAVHTDLGSGQLQTLILGWQLLRGRATLFVVKEPELHLHAERQKSVLRAIRDRSRADNAHFVIETHSPVFLGTGPGERVVLVTKDTGRSSAIEIVPDNVDLIRRELGITHADALSPANILFVEGRSDLVAFGSFLRIVAPDHALSTMVYTLGGAHNTKNLKMLIKYLEAEGRRMFVILDKNDRARRQVEELEGAGLLASNYHFLGMNIEDEFDDDLVIKAACEVAAEAGGDLALTAAELRASRDGGEAVAATLEGRWNAEKCGNFSKIKLAERIVGLAGERVPPGIEATLREAVAHFEGGGSSGAGPAAGSRGAGPSAPEGAGSGADRVPAPHGGRSP